MEHLFKSWKKVEGPLQDQCLFLFLDYDGTISPIAETPHQAATSQENTLLLQKLVKLPCCQTAIISGRELSDVKTRVGVDGITYVGNHGFEIDHDDLHFKGLNKKTVEKVLGRLYKELNKVFARIKGVIIENKGWSLSVHYRLVKEEDIGKFNDAFSKVCKPYLAKKKIKINTGKKLFEVRPPVEWDKGTVVECLLHKRRPTKNNSLLPIYIGDDQTDEDAFYTLKKSGITVRVGFVESSAANYFVDTTEEVSEFFKRILELRGAGV